MLTDAQAIARQLASDPLRNVVLLKHLRAYPEHARAVMVRADTHSATLVVVAAAAVPFDRKTYPQARYVVLIESDAPALTAALTRHVPRDGQSVVKLSCEADRAVVASHVTLHRATSFISFTADAPTTSPDIAATVDIADRASDAMYALYAEQDHDRAWLAAELAAARAFTCAYRIDGEPVAVCFAVESYDRVWEIGGVVTAAGHRGRGYGKAVVRAPPAAAALSGKRTQHGVTGARPFHRHDAPVHADARPDGAMIASCDRCRNHAATIVSPPAALPDMQVP